MRMRLTLVSGLLASAATLHSFQTPAQAGEALRPLTIQVIDFHGVPSTTLIRAQHHVVRAFGAIGVTVRWRETQTLDQTDASPVAVVLLLSPAMSTKKVADSRLSPLVLAVTAPPPTCRSWIFTGRVLDAAFLHDQVPGELLGHTIAHEVAHSVGHAVHASKGAMRESVILSSGGLDDMFGAVEAGAVRAELRPNPPESTQLAARRTR
jgi:hypothetical protein